MSTQWIAAFSETTLLRDKPWLVLCWGAPAAGKSTISRALCQSLQQRGLVLPRVSSDAINQSMIGDQFQPALRAAIYDGLLALAAGILKRDGALVLDGTFVNFAMRQQVAHLAEQCAAVFVSVHVTCPLAVRLQRNAWRGPAERVPEDWLRAAHFKAHHGGTDSHLHLDTARLEVQVAVERVTAALIARLRQRHGLVRRRA